jgi:hypothetical protein
VRAVIVLLVWAAAVVLALVILGVLGYELFGHLSRLRRAVVAARRELLPLVDRLKPASAAGRHRAGAGTRRPSGPTHAAR